MNQTRVGYEANLTHPQTVKYLREFVDLGLIILTDFKPYTNNQILTTTILKMLVTKTKYK